MSLYKIPIRSTEDEPGLDPSKSITLIEFIELLRVEEDYWEGEQHNTKLIITRLRKIFYDLWGWDKYLIRGAKDIETRYITTVVGKPTEFSTEIRHFKKGKSVPKHRVVTYSSHDRVYGDTRVGQSPPIVNKNYQSVRLPSGYYCHVAHILGVLDAFNYPQIASPMPSWLLWLAKLGPHCDYNTDLVSWLDDLAEGESEIINMYRRTGKPLTFEEEQKCIDDGATGADMISDIDGYIIARHFDIGSNNGMRLTDILTEYYTSEAPDAPRRKRCTTFCEMIGLEGWDGNSFSNEEQWLRRNRNQLRDASTFQIFSETGQKILDVWVPLLVWLNFYKKVLKVEKVLASFLAALKNEVKLENKTE